MQPCGRTFCSSISSSSSFSSLISFSSSSSSYHVVSFVFLYIYFFSYSSLSSFYYILHPSHFFQLYYIFLSPLSCRHLPISQSLPLTNFLSPLFLLHYLFFLLQSASPPDYCFHLVPLPLPPPPPLPLPLLLLLPLPSSSPPSLLTSLTFLGGPLCREITDHSP